MTENTREHLLRQGHLQKMSLLPAGCCILHKSYTPLRLIICMFYHSDFLGLSFPSGIKWLHIDLPSPVTSTTGCCFCFGSVPSFFLESVLHGSPVAYWAPTDLGSFSFSVLSFAFSYCSWGFQGKNTEVACHSLLQWITFCQNISCKDEIIYAKMGSIKDRNGMDITEAEDIKKRWQEYTEELYKK